MTNPNDRRLAFKLPPTKLSQEARRAKALEEQKRRRAQRFDSSRQLDLFANLNINDDSDSDDEILGEGETKTVAAPSAVGPYVAMLKAGDPADNPLNFSESPVPPVEAAPDVGPPTEKKKRRRRNKKRNNNYNKPSKWADQCMYAELLEMTADEHLWASGQDGLPQDLETGWVAVAPVPVGKRCLVVTHQSPGLGGVVPNTTLRSRLLGKSLIPRFPSPLPALTVLDCILDANWRDNGIIHVLDVIRWKGQDVGDCEAPFRFWWRDTRLAEISRTLPPTVKFLSKKPKHGTATDSSQSNRYQFPHPTYFLPIPYHTDTSLLSLQNQVIPAALSTRTVTVDAPLSIQPLHEHAGRDHEFNFSMDVEGPPNSSPASSFTFAPSSASSVTLSPAPALIQSDGMLLYVAEASYEPGTSPLSSWVPISSVQGDMDTDSSSTTDSPLELFQKLVKRRLDRGSCPPNLNVEAQDPGADISMDL
ncbi:hypothetical protein CC1G_05317 [Coprinopsis cinerea okayama7|uniref:Snurportin-1 n=1 Tax=Coprinopsis cinerea (strain Okayama-7 / 130 / ATCC MYA-4618 / FGSC 9003) TaxID=240176 RepID=A8PCM0_COPC7|nr:hypothetical protein CC1G_05317 [Coprinopsis cinerea okayama7\|eukprot:XP_001840431.2 hypothetical protein CC1G_05317 [Coprinopsis cinerea okayama7\